MRGCLPLTRTEKADARVLFEAGAACEHCGGVHHRACPRIKRKAFHPNGNLIEVEYWPDYPQDGIIWPEDAYDPEDGADER